MPLRSCRRPTPLPLHRVRRAAPPSQAERPAAGPPRPPLYPGAPAGPSTRQSPGLAIRRGPSARRGGARDPRAALRRRTDRLQRAHGCPARPPPRPADRGRGAHPTRGLRARDAERAGNAAPGSRGEDCRRSRRKRARPARARSHRPEPAPGPLQPPGSRVSACDGCLRRTRLIVELRGYLEYLHAERGVLDEVFSLDDDELLMALVTDAPARRRVRERIRATKPSRQRAEAAARGMAILCRHDSGYPGPLLALQGPPAALFVRGATRLPAFLDSPAVAVVGARRASPYGLEMARALGRGLAAAGLTVVSGMALGVDSAAHAGALEAGARTVAVLAGGADVPYPASKRSLH